MIQKPISKTVFSVNITEELLKIFREKYRKQFFKGDTEAICHLIRKYVEDA